MARNRYDMDEILEDSFDVNQLKRLAGYIAPYKKKMAGVILLMLSSSALTMAIPIFFQNVMDHSIPEKDMKSITFYSIATLLIALYSGLSLRIKIKTMSVIGQDIVHDIRYDIFCHLQELPFSYYDDRPHGKIQVRVVNYVNSLSDLLSNGIVNTFTDLCNLIFILMFMFALDVRMADADLSVRIAGSCICDYLNQEKTAQGMADPEQQTVKLKCVHCGEYQWNPCDAVFCKGK